MLTMALEILCMRENKGTLFKLQIYVFEVKTESKISNDIIINGY